MGRCYELAGDYIFTVLPDPEFAGVHLVHGAIQRRDKRELPNPHAWVDLCNGEIWEPVTDKLYPEPIFAALYNPTEYVRYGRLEAVKTMWRHRNYGAWDAQSARAHRAKKRENKRLAKLAQKERPDARDPDR